MKLSDWSIVAMQCVAAVIVAVSGFVVPFTVTDAFLEGCSNEVLLTPEHAGNIVREVVQMSNVRESALIIPLLLGSVALLVISRLRQTAAER